MSKLATVSLESVCTKVTDGTHDSPKLQKTGVPFIKATHITNGFVDFDNSDFITQEDHERVIARSNPEYKDILFTNIGASIGATAIINSKIEFSIKNVALFKPNSQKIDPDYLYFKVISNEFQEGIKNYRSGAAQPFVSLGSLREFKFEIHENIEEQTAIARTLVAYDNLIENNNRRIDILEDMAQSLYGEWFVKFRFPGHESFQLKDSSLGQIPEGWCLVELGEVITIRKGKNITKITTVEGDVPVVAGGLKPAYYHNQANTRSPVVTVSASGANAGYVNLYYEDIWASDCSYIDPDISPFVYFYYLLLKDRQYEITRMQTGAAQPHVYPADLMRLEISCVPEGLLNTFSQKVSPLFEMIKNLSVRNKNLAEQRDMLLPKLITGTIKIKD
tara:strand:- start:12490 stop:13662 length:1173 start_codon:yes stop_codon:yes gene_type:complete